MIEPRRIGFMNMTLFGITVVLAVAVMAPKPAIPIVDEDSLAWLKDPGASASGPTKAPSVYPELGKVDPFRVVVPRPTPTPTPVPTPPPDPSLEEAVANWRVNGVLKTFAVFSDKQSKNEWTMKLGGEPLTATVDGHNIRVVLLSTDMKSGTVVLIFDGPQGRQTVTKKVSDDDQ